MTGSLTAEASGVVGDHLGRDALSSIVVAGDDGGDPDEAEHRDETADHDRRDAASPSPRLRLLDLLLPQRSVGLLTFTLLGTHRSRRLPAARFSERVDAASPRAERGRGVRWSGGLRRGTPAGEQQERPRHRCRRRRRSAGRSCPSGRRGCRTRRRATTRPAPSAPMAMPTMPSVITYSQPSPGRKMKNPLPRWLIAHATAMTPTMPAAANGVSSPTISRRIPLPISVRLASQACTLRRLHPHRPEPSRRAVDRRADVVDAVRQHHGTRPAAQDQEEREVDRVGIVHRRSLAAAVRP